MSQSQGSLNVEESNNYWIENPGSLTRQERVWAGRQTWLEEAGYMLRPRYRPDWAPSWTNTKKWYYDCEDGPVNPVRLNFTLANDFILSGRSQAGHTALDAVCISDGSLVMLKYVTPNDYAEVEISQLLSSEPLSSDPRNHCNPLLETLRLPEPDDGTLLVSPMLRKFNDPPFLTIGEAVAFFTQIFEVYVRRVILTLNSCK